MALKIYHVHPLVMGPLREWGRQFERIRGMGFDYIDVAPIFQPGEDADIFVTADHERVHPALEWEGDADSAFARIAQTAESQGLRILSDIVLDRVATNAPVFASDPAWFSTGFCGGPPDPRRARRIGLAITRFTDTNAAHGLIEWWAHRLGRMLHAGIAGFRFPEPGDIPVAVWRQLISALRQVRDNCLLIAWTPGTDRGTLQRMQGLAFDATCASTAWWDGRAPWLVDEIEALRRVAPPLASPEPSFMERLAPRLPHDADLAGAYRHKLRIAACLGDGLFVPMGFEFAARHAFSATRADTSELERARSEASIDLSEDVADTNDLVDRVAALQLHGQMRALSSPAEPVTALLRADADDIADARAAAVVVINPNLNLMAEPPPMRPLPPQAGAAFGDPEPVESSSDIGVALKPGEVRVVAYTHLADVTVPERAATVEAAPMRAARIAIEDIQPRVPDGDFPVKRVTGESVTVSADIFADGHELLSAALLWRAADEMIWRHVPMRLTVNDRWEATFTPQRIGPHLFTVEAWWDVWGTFRHDLHAKHAAGQNVSLEVQEGRGLMQAAAARTSGPERDAIQRLLDRVTDDVEGAVDLLLSDAARNAMRAADDQPFSARHAPPLHLDVDRPQAVFASWYELFPRSATNDPRRHGTFDDVIARLPQIRAMGFDVVYFPPIHPIGTINRKGRNNSLRAEPGDVGSPYAIGSAEGGHTAVHPQLGTLEDFRRLVDATRRQGMEIAIDFAIQCSPDHPWLREHPDWFRWRPDGSMRYAENPPKKYEDIVNPDFYADAAIPGVWFALRDVIQFWVDQGVRTFRVDNPHTKPLPFWRWMIADIRSRHPDALFLSEAFTRPKMMYRLAKVGFNQSYTYFTWRNTKYELASYLTELNSAPIRDFFRPNFFVNTPDINPHFLQTSGRAGFLIRAALATTLSGLWGMYSGFELCESAPLPGREEYLDSEKYEIRVRDYTAPGNIVAEITALNHIRRAHPALQTHLELTFYNAFNDQVLLYGKRAPGSREIVLVAVSLDPHHAQEAAIEVPVWEFGLPDSGSVQVTDLMRDSRFVWHGKNQRIRLDPAELPFSIWQIQT